MHAPGEGCLEEVTFERGVPRWREQNLNGADSCGGGCVGASPVQALSWEGPGKGPMPGVQVVGAGKRAAGGGGRQEEVQGSEGGTGERGEAEEGGLRAPV